MDAQKTLELLEAHPFTRKIREEREAEILQVRMEAAERLAHSKEEAARVLPELQAAEDAARQAVKTHDKQRRELEGAIARAAAARAEERLRLEREMAAAERILLENYSEKIDEAIMFFRDRFDALRAKKPSSDRDAGETNIFTLRKEIISYTNYPAIRDALAYCSRAIFELEQMRLSPALDAERIEELKRGIPDADAMTEYSSDKPILPPTPPSEYQLLKMEEAAGIPRYLLEKLHQKIEAWKQGATKSPKASAGKRDAPAIPGPAPAPRREATLDYYQQEKRKIRAFLGGGSLLDPRR
jgi:hypothetical protein